MNREMELYQEIASRTYRRHQRSEGEELPPFHSPAMSRYPNILAELDGSNWWLSRMAWYVEASKPIMAEVMVNNGRLNIKELSRLTRFFGCKRSYLLSPALSLVDPSTNKGRVRIHRLKELVKKAAGLDCFLYNLHYKSVLPTLESGQPVTYATYRWACNSLQSVLDRQEMDEATKQRIRTSGLPARPEKKPDASVPLASKLKEAREKAQNRKLAARLIEITMFAADVTDGKKVYTTEDLSALKSMARLNLFDALVLAIDYGCAIGYKTAKGNI